MRHRFGLLALVLLGSCSTGCQEADREQLRKVGNRTALKLQEAAGGPRGRSANVLHGIRGSLAVRNSDDRVAARLRFEKGFEAAEISTRLIKPGVIELSGTVPSSELKSQAVSVASGTTGVEQVLDRLTVTPPKK